MKVKVGTWNRLMTREKMILLKNAVRFNKMKRY